MKSLLFLCLFVSAGAFAQEQTCLNDFNTGVQAYNTGNSLVKLSIEILAKANTAKTKDEACKLAGDALYHVTESITSYETAKAQFLAAIVSCSSQPSRVKVQNALKQTIDKYVDALFMEDGLPRQMDSIGCK